MVERAARMPRGLRGLWHRLTGQFQETRGQNEREAEAQRLSHASERQKLIDGQLAQRGKLQLLFKDLRHRQAEQLLGLRRDVGRYLALAREAEPERTRGMSRTQEAGLGLRLER